MNLLRNIRDLFTAHKRRTPATGLGQPPSLAQTLSVDRLQSILRAAEAGDPIDLFSIYRDILIGHAHTQTEWNKRKLAALTKSLTFVPYDDDNPDDKRLADLADRYIGRHPHWLNPGLNHLLDGHLYPVSVLEPVWAPAPRNPHGIRIVPAAFIPVPWHLLTWTSGRLEIYDADPVFGNRLATKAEPDPDGYIIHRGHLLQSIPDNWGGPMRAALFWWLFATMDRDWWVAFLERFGSPFIVGRYDQGDDQSRRTLAAAFSAAKRLFGLVISRDTEVEIHEVQTRSHGEAFEKMHSVANAELSKLILGQTMTTTAAPGGIGGTQAEVQDRVRADIEAWDITALSATVRDQVVAQFARLNGLAGCAELAVATSSAPEIGEKANLLAALTNAGLELTDEGIEALSQESGLPIRRAAGSLDPVRPANPSSAPQSSQPVTSPATTPEALTAAPPPPASVRKAQAQSAPPLDQLDRVATAAAPALAEAFRGTHAPVRQIVLDSTSAEDLEAKLATFYADWPAARLAALTQDALTAYAANGAAAGSRA